MGKSNETGQLHSRVRKSWDMASQPQQNHATNLQGRVRLRGLNDDSSRYAPPPIPPLPPLNVEPPPSFSPPVSSRPAVIESVSSILSHPPRIPLAPLPSHQFSGFNTTYATMLTEQQVINTLKEKKEEKERKDREKENRKRAREEKRQEKANKPPPQPRKKRSTSIRLRPTSANKENTPPNSSQDVVDPYE